MKRQSSKPFVYTSTTQVDTCTTCLLSSLVDQSAAKVHILYFHRSRHNRLVSVCTTIDPCPSLSHGHFIGGGDKIKPNNDYITVTRLDSTTPIVSNPFLFQSMVQASSLLFDNEAFTAGIKSRHLLYSVSFINGRQDGSSRGWGSMVPLLQVNVSSIYLVFI